MTAPDHGVDHAEIVADLAYRYDGVFTRSEVEGAVAAARGRLEPTAKIPAFLPVLVSRFARDALLAKAQAEGRVAKSTPEILFVCVHNAGRSQMAAAIAEHRSGGRVHVRSAGSAPTGEINPSAIVVLAEIGIDVSESFPKPLTDDVVRAADVIVTMGCGDACPIYPGKRYLDWPVADPAGQPVDVVRSVRDDIDVRVTALVHELLDNRAPETTDS